ncbi:MAG: hypothetical protein M1335_01575 [Chloroflexi bacterium]|nr:hypothetical protein [Chloroflexota bacterium]MCL5025355.1 hypothetical protein [Chloroflexota bacterium]
MVYWAPLLHFYQPPLQLPRVLRKVCDESYRPLIEVFRQYPNAKVTVNICGVLTEMLWEGGYQDVVNGLRELAARGQIEFTGSAKYHPILPLIPNEEIERQIRRNFLTNRRYFGEEYAPKGFFPPEMAYGPSILEPVIESRHQWILLSGVACPATWPVRQVYQAGSNDETLAVFFRDDILSNRISFHNIDDDGFLAHLRRLRDGQKDAYVITAMDAETFGHHVQNWEKLFLAEVYEALGTGNGSHRELQQSQPLATQHEKLFAYSQPADVDIEAVTISELLERFPRGPEIEPLASSWSTSKEDIAAGNIYPLWKDPHNVVHWLQWHHLNLCIELVHQAEKCAEGRASRRFADIARHLLDEAEHSCQFWWASKRPMWDINMIARGLAQQTQAILNAYKALKLGRCDEAVRSEFYYKVVGMRDLAAKIYDRLYED